MALLRVGPAINSQTGEWNLWVSADEQELIFEASSRSTNISVSGDLYYSWRTPAGWAAAVPVTGLNSGGSELMPRMHPDGNTLYYTTAAMGGHTVQRRIRLDAAPLNILIHPTRDIADVSLPRMNAVAEIDLASGAELRRIRTGIEPDGLRWVSRPD